MDSHAIKDRVRAGMEAEFLPDPSPDTLSQVDCRMANAAEYIAYHLGQIDNKLDRLIAGGAGAKAGLKRPAATATRPAEPVRTTGAAVASSFFGVPVVMSDQVRHVRLVGLRLQHDVLIGAGRHDRELVVANSSGFRGLGDFIGHSCWGHLALDAAAPPRLAGERGGGRRGGRCSWRVRSSARRAHDGVAREIVEADLA